MVGKKLSEQIRPLKRANNYDVAPHPKIQIFYSFPESLYGTIFNEEKLC